MTNRSSSKQHGLSSANQQRPKSKERNRRNKAKARPRSEARHQVIADKKAAIIGKATAKTTTKAAPKKEATATETKATA